jgi:phenylacetate-CoA ligase
MIESEGLSKNIIVTGEIKDMETLIREYEDADAFINTSLSDNFPMVFLEAGASGLPVITTNVGGIPHILKDNENALFIPPGNPDALAEKIIQLIENPYLVERLSTSIRLFAEENSWEDVRKRLIRVYSLEGKHDSR